MGIFSSKDDLFNNAVEHYKKAQTLFVDTELSPEFKNEVYEIIRLCQLEINKNKNNGDAYVLLANGYGLAATVYSGKKVVFDFFMDRSQAVIYQWAAGKYHTKNKEAGAQILNSCLGFITETSKRNSEQAQEHMKLTNKRLVTDALDPESLDIVGTLLGQFDPEIVDWWLDSEASTRYGEKEDLPAELILRMVFTAGRTL